MTFSIYRIACGSVRACKSGKLPDYIHFLNKTRCSRIVVLPSKVRHIATSSTYLDHNRKNSQDSFSTCRNKPQISNVWTVPNLLCGLRIFAAPFLCFFITDHAYFSAISVLTIAGLSDVADGYIARNYKGQSSKLGTFLDPLADKVLIITLYSSMAFTGLIPVLLMKIIVFRDIILLSAGMYIRYISVPPPRTMRKCFDSSSSEVKLQPTYLSKINTVLQIVVAVVSLYAPTTAWITDNSLSFLWYTAGFSTVTSGLSYMFSRNTFHLLKNAKEAPR